MSEGKFTPGPWLIFKDKSDGPNEWSVGYPDFGMDEAGGFRFVASVRAYSGGDSLATARLIAAAPELLAACLAVHAILLKGTVNTPDYEWEDMAGDVMRAVARARGEAVL